jgi:hypothetical protein
MCYSALRFSQSVGTVAKDRRHFLEWCIRDCQAAGGLCDFELYLADSTLTNHLLTYAEKGPQPALATVPKELVPFTRDAWRLLLWYTPYLAVLSTPLGAHSTEEQAAAKADDQQALALCLACMLVPTFHDTVRLRDDGCGFLFAFLAYVRTMHGEAYLRRLKIELVDVDPRVTAWQKAMYRCPQITFLTEPLVKYGVALPRTTLLYLNYRSIAASFETVRVYLAANAVECLLSFSTPSASEKDYSKSLITLNRSAKHDIFLKKLPAADRELTTYIITPYRGREAIVDGVRNTLNALIVTV